jgi:hypothetical protein
MVEIIMMISVIAWFVVNAKRRDQNEYLWAAIGGLSFYIPVLLFAFYLYPFLAKDAFSGSQYRIIGFFGNLIAGLIGVFIAVRILKKRKSPMD